MKRPTITDVAKKANVSIATVSRVLNGDGQLISRSTSRKVQEAIKLLDYRPQSAGRALRSKRTKIVAVIVPDVLNTTWAAIASSIETSLRQQGKVMFLCNTQGDPEIQDFYLEEIKTYLVSGTVFAGAIASEQLEKYLGETSDVIFVGRKAPVESSKPFVGLNNYAAGRDVGSLFLDKGYYPCGIIHGPFDSSVSLELFNGFRDRLMHSGYPLAAHHVLESEWSFEGGYGAANVLLHTKPRPRAIFCANDMIAHGLHRKCQEMKLRVPADVAIFGYDDNPLNEWLAPWLSTIRLPYVQIGPAVSHILNDFVKTDRRNMIPQIILPHELVMRASA